MEITKALPTSKLVLELEPEELASYLLDHLRGNDSHLHLENVFGSRGIQAHYDNNSRVEHALREAWAWLVNEGLLVQRNSNGWYFISRRAETLLSKQDFEAFRRSGILPKDSLHPLIAEKVWPSFLRGDYETAVFQAFKEIEVAVRTGGDFANTDFGTALMNQAFNVNTGPLTDMTLPEPERIGMRSLFFGAVSLFKNPSSHRHVVLTDPNETAEIISFASLLMRIIEQRTGARTAQ